MKLKIFFLSHDQNILDDVPEMPFATEKVLLGSLPLGEFQDNRLGEGRAFLADLNTEGADYLGFLNARLLEKYNRWQIHRHRNDMSWDRVKDLPSRLAIHKVIAPWNAPPDWAAYSESQHPNMLPILQRMAAHTNMRLDTAQPSLWGNDFICESHVWLSWRVFWRNTFEMIHGWYGWDPPYLVTPNMDPNRKPAYIYERITTLYFGNRPELTIEAL